MNQRVKKLWLKALRSGEYEQARAELRTGDGEQVPYRYCCLGVLEKLRCDAQKKRFPDGKEVLTEVTMRWAGLNDNNPDVQGNRSLAELNDSGKSFAYIANRIEKYL